MKKLFSLSFLFFFSLLSYAQSNIVINGDFESGLNEWSYWFDNPNGYYANIQTTNSNVYEGNSSAEINITGIGSNANYTKIMIKNTSFSLTQNVTYNVSFALKSSSAQNFLVEVHQDNSPYTSYATHYYNANTTWQNYTFSFVSPLNTSDVRFTFKMGNAIADYFVDAVVISEEAPINYTTVLDSNYSIDWSNSGVSGGIPNISNVVDVTNFGAIGDGFTDNLIAFENALNTVAAGEALFIPAGEYLINGSLTLPEGVVLRGACPTNTKLLFNVGSNDDCIAVYTYNYGTFRPLTAGNEKGSNVITLQYANDISVGDYLQIQQENDSSLMYTNPLWDVTWAEESVGQLFKVTEVNNNELTLDRPIFYGFNINLNVEARTIALIENVGIENLYIEKLDANDGSTIDFTNAVNCWVKNVESNTTFRSHINMTRTLDCEISTCYFHKSHDYGGGGHGYGVNLSRHVTSCLIENNIFDSLRHAMLVQVGATGNVFAYNYSTNPIWSISTTNIPPDISMHGHFPTMNLFEANIVQEATFSDYWGPVGPGNTMFRNRVEQFDIDVNEYSHHQNVIANELTSASNTINIESSVLSTWNHSNNTNGNVQILDSVSIPASLYLSKFPEFLNSYPFPTLGFDVAGLNNLPAKDRYDSGNPMLACLCNNLNNCYEECIEVLDDSYLGGGNPNEILQNQYYATDSILSSGTIKNNNTTGFHANEAVILLPGFSAESFQLFEADNNGCVD